MARYLVATHTATLTRDWLCGRCNAFGQATVRARGEAEKRVWFSRDAAADTAHDRAADALQRDADRITALVRCPKCRERAPGALLGTLWHGLPDLWLGVVAAAVVGGIAVVELHGTLIPIVLAVVAFVLGVAIGDERRRWGAAARAEVVLAPRKPARPALEPVRAPTAPVSADPFRAPPAPPLVAVVRPPVEAAAPIVPSDSAEQPTFLR